MSSKIGRGTLWCPRRDFLAGSVWASFWAVAAGFAVIVWEFLSPRKQPLSNSEFIAGRLFEYVVGEVSDRWIREHQTWIVRDRVKLYAVWARCTHMNCTTHWNRNRGLFDCPCHRSQFEIDGRVRGGLARRPLERFQIAQNSRGEIVVDKSVVFARPQDWEQPGAYIRVQTT